MDSKQVHTKENMQIVEDTIETAIHGASAEWIAMVIQKSAKP